MVTLVLPPYTILLKSEPGVDAVFNNVYEAGESTWNWVNEVTITVLDDIDDIVGNCLLRAHGGATSVGEAQMVLDKSTLYICCGDHVFAISLPNLSLLWKVEADFVTCFQIFELEQDLLVHGELLISRIDKGGNIIWHFGGKDIFASLEGDSECKILSDHILLRDFNGDHYKLDFMGKQLPE